MKQIYSTFTNTNYGSVGILTPMTYSNGSPIHTGDIVSVSHKYHPYLDSENVVVYDNNEYFRMGLGGCKFTNGEYGDWKIVKYEKWNEHNRDKVRDLIFKPTDKVKLSINQCYKDSNINITKTNITSVQIRNPKYSTNVSLINFYIGENELTISQANSIIKVMGLNYELTDSVDWSSVAIGTEVEIKIDKGDCGWSYNCTFKEYVKETNQIIVSNGNKVEVYNESEVSLCN